MPIFDAFISYSRGASGELAAGLQNGLERYARPWNRLRASRVFRDDSNLSANPGLWTAIRQGLESSRWLILIATPEAAASPYVDREVSWWIQEKGLDSILVVLAGGELRWKDPGRGFVPSPHLAVPPSLVDAYEEEPRWVDMSWFDGAQGRDDPRFQTAVADLASAIRGVDRDTLVADNMREAKKLRRITRSGVSALATLLVISVGAGILAVQQRVEATDQRNAAVAQADVATARQLAAESRNLTSRDMTQALRAAVSGYVLNPDNQTTSALHDAVAANPQLLVARDVGAKVTATAGTDDGRTVVVGTEDGQVLLWRDFIESAEPEEIMQLEGSVSFVGLSDGQELQVVASAETAEVNEYGTAGVVSTDSAKWVDGIVAPLSYPVAGMSPSGDTLVEWAFVNGQDSLDGVRVVVHRGDSSPERYDTGGSSDDLVVPDDSTVVASDSYGNVTRVDLESGRAHTKRLSMGLWMFGMAISPDGRYFTFTNGSEDFPIWDMAGTPPRVALHGSGPDADPVDIALSDGAHRLATSTEGKLFVSGTTAKPAVPALELAGAGTPNPDTLFFVGQDRLMSGSGNQLQLWDLGIDNRIGSTLSVNVPTECSGCGPPQVAVDETGERAVVLSSFGDDLLFVNLRDMSNRKLEGILRTTGWDRSFSTITAVKWWGDDLVVYSAGAQEVVVLQGPTYDHAVETWFADFGYVNLPDPTDDGSTSDGGPQFPMDATGQAVYRSQSSYPDLTVDAAGTLVAATGERLFDLDLSTGSVHESAFPGGHLNNNGTVAVRMEQNLSTSSAEPDETDVTVYEVAGRRVVFDRPVPGRIVAQEAASPEAIYLWRSNLDGSYTLVFLNALSGEMRDVGLMARPTEPRTLSQSTFATASEGTVSVTDLTTQTSALVFSGDIAVRKWTSLGLSGDAKRLVVTNEPSHTITVLDVSPAAWLAAACKTGDLRYTDEEWSNLTGRIGGPPSIC